MTRYQNVIEREAETDERVGIGVNKVSTQAKGNQTKQIPNCTSEICSSVQVWLFHSVPLLSA